MPLWDLPIRIFHWTLVIAVLVAVVSAKLGGEWMTLHGKAGFAILGLLSFRLAWGFAGSKYARFAQFFPTPSKLRRYLQGSWKARGHNPLGAISVFALLGLLALQAGGGLLTDDEISFTGPLAHLIDTELAVRLTGLHHQLSNIVLGLVALHIVAIIFYRVVKRKNLLTPMITGVEQVPAESAFEDIEEQNERRGQRRHTVALAVSLALAIAVAYGASSGFGTRTQAELVVAPAVSSSNLQDNVQKPAPAPAW
ncbi:cytochrome b/b6 domain-containing protein [Undibacterium sp. LX15W]|uniref:Cytochrome b/b6 domain-containing protein n=2 Tax=Undibacterium flavidum TaxID=2762297 RepID=A0ABR6YBJ2_9BURK|nr:cytochrome b/b6 domain-containing protein [Undibacterium flavidum]